MQNITLAALTLVVTLTGCAVEPAATIDKAAVIAASMPIAQGFQAELKAAIADGGPPGGVSVCQQAAPAIAQAQSEASGAAVSRIAEKHRNPTGAVPEALGKAYAALKAAPMVDGKPNSQIVQTGSGANAKVHFLSAIPMQEQPCSACHGTNIAPELKAHIDQLYPADLATGFAPGELRGALLISWDAAKFLQ